jgi:plastocyanin
VTWTNDDNTSHNATFSNAAITSTGTFATGSQSVVMPAAAGTYSYTCTIHGGMNGTVKVQ